MTSSVPAMQAVVELFATSLAEVKFGDVDAQSLSRLAAEVEAAASVLASSQAALEAAKSALLEREGALLLHTTRALAYARVYAEKDEALSAKLEAITLPRAPRRPRGSGKEVTLASSEVVTPDRPRVKSKKSPREAMVEDAVLSAE